MRSLAAALLLLALDAYGAQPNHCVATADGQVSRFTWAAQLSGCSAEAIHDGEGEGAVIYVIDTGVLAMHDEFMTPSGSRVIAGIDVIASGQMPLDDECGATNRATEPCSQAYRDSEVTVGHGTGVASLAAGNRVGVAPRAWIVSVRGLSTAGTKTTRSISDSLDAIAKYAWSESAPPFHTAIVNMSFVLDPDDHIDALLHKIRTMIGGIDASGASDPIHGKRFLFVAAAGNLDSCRETHLVTLAPAVWGRATPGLITVGGASAGAKRAWAGGCGGEGVEMLAPAENIVSAFHTAPDDYRAARSGRSGTSWSAAIVSGMAACILSKDKTLTPEQLEAKLVH